MGLRVRRHGKDSGDTESLADALYMRRRGKGASVCGFDAMIKAWQLT